ncbi:hypothetical protein PENDEC_c014G02069 [Penicillium decumbens]|uniref:Uncharacterized protein n=1 Tax=Penicillium decumbens TaxID=69771 RepID=A0A1V6PA33_PENDC|nr:hypothetical protein PENDEC_c014G02069 [Penicillium decumbens]
MPQQRDCLVVSNDVDAIPTSPSLNVPPTTGRIVVLNGFPGTGKLTILEKAKELLPADTTILLDNHLLIDPVMAVIPGRSDEHHELRRKLRAPIFEKLGERAQEGCVILMTACLAEDNPRDTAFLKKHLDMVRGTDVPVIWVNAYCGQTVLEQRLGSPERCQGIKTKLTDVRVLQDLIREHRLVEPSNSADGSAKLY